MTKPDIASYSERQIQRWRVSLMAFFVLMGGCGSAWVVRLPLIRHNIHASNLDFGLMGLCGAAGSLIGISFANRIVQRVGTRAAMMLGFFVGPIGFATSGICVAQHWSHGVQVVAGSYFLTGIAMTCSDIAINVDGSAIERFVNRSVLPRLHAWFSVGATAGAGVGTLCAATHTSIALQMGIISLLMFCVPLATMRYLPGIQGEAKEKATAKDARREWLDASLIILSLSIFILTAAEGAASSWLSLVINEVKHLNPVYAGAGVFCFTSAMTVIRWFSGPYIDRWRVSDILRGFALVGVVGMLLLALGGGPIVTLTGSLLWGVGIALGFPLCISASGRSRHNPARRVVFTATFGYFAFLMGPPIMGFVAQRWGLRTVPYAVLSCFLVTLVMLQATHRLLQRRLDLNHDAVTA